MIPSFIKSSLYPHPSITPFHLSLSTSVFDSQSYHTIMSKETYGSEAPASNGHATYVDPTSGMGSKAGVMNEAGEIYGNIETAEEYGYVQRG